MALTDTTARHLKPLGGKRELLVADVGGLYLRIRVGTTGKITRTWQFRGARGDGLAITTLGTYPAMSLKQARLKAAEMALKKNSTESPTVAEAAD